MPDILERHRNLTLVHTTISPRTIITGQRISYDKHCRENILTNPKYMITHQKLQE